MIIVTLRIKVPRERSGDFMDSARLIVEPAKIQKLLVIAASVCLLAVFVSGPAYALSPLAEIILAFCEEVADDAGEAANELEDAAGDLADCPDEYDNCIGGISNDE